MPGGIRGRVRRDCSPAAVDTSRPARRGRVSGTVGCGGCTPVRRTYGVYDASRTSAPLASKSRAVSGLELLQTACQYPQ